MHYWADLQSVHGFRCYDNIAQTRNVSEWLVLAVCLVIVRNHMLNFLHRTDMENAVTCSNNDPDKRLYIKSSASAGVADRSEPKCSRCK